jgi:hypothetical protein
MDNLNGPFRSQKRPVASKSEAANRGGLFASFFARFKNTLQRMLVQPGKIQALGDFPFGFLAWIKSTRAGALVVDAKHCALCGLEIHVEEALQDLNDKLHWGEIVIHQAHAMQRLFLRHGMFSGPVGLIRKYPGGKKMPQLAPGLKIEENVGTNAGIGTRRTEATSGALQMVIPHWLIGAAMFAAIGAFVVFAFRQGQAVKPDRNKLADAWTNQTGGGVPPPGA